MLAVAIIIGVVYYTLNHKGKLKPDKEKHKINKSEMNSYEENERIDYQLR